MNWMRDMVETKFDDAAYSFDDPNECLISQQLKSHDLVFQVKDIISAYRQLPFPDFDTVAQALQIKPQVLRRFLKGQNTNFQDIKDSVRCEMATVFLKNTHKKIGQIAPLVGFSNTSAFHRAFRAWTGKSPSEFRQTDSNI